MEGEEAVTEARKSWVEKARSYLKRKRGDEGGFAALPERKKRRVKSYQLMLMWDNILMQHCEFGLEQFVPPKAPDGSRQPPWSWLGLSIAADQGPDVKCAASFLLRKLGCNIDFTDDMSHGAWNDGRCAMKACALWKHELLCISCYNCVYGSLYSPPRLRQVRDAAEEYLTLNDHSSCPLFAHFLPFIVEEQELDMPPSAPACAKKVWSLLKNSDILWTLGDKVGLCRCSSGKGDVFSGRSSDEFQLRIVFCSSGLRFTCTVSYSAGHRRLSFHVL